MCIKEVIIENTLNADNALNMTCGVLASLDKFNILQLSFGRNLFFSPDGLAILINLIAYVKKTGRNARYSISKKTDGFKYLEDFGFFDLFKTNANHPNIASPRRSTILPVQQLSSGTWVSFIQSDMARWFARNLNTDERVDFISELKMIVDELSNNIDDHSMEKIGVIFGQHYPKQKIIELAVSDIGIGIPSSLRQHYPALNDCNLILKAIEKGVSAKSTNRNKGHGLDNIIYCLCNRNSSVDIYSGKGKVSIFPKREPICTELSLDFKGTLFHIKIDTENLSGCVISDETGDIW